MRWGECLPVMSSQPVSVLKLPRHNAPQPLFHRLDLRDPAALDEVFTKYDSQGGIWAVVHLAALKAVGESGEKPLDYYQINVAGSIALLQVRARPYPPLL